MDAGPVVQMIASVMNADTGAIPPDAKVAPQIVEAFMKIFLMPEVMQPPVTCEAGLLAMDQDLTGLPVGSGNAGGTIVYRLRDGVERMLVTDVTNAGASAKGQSEIPVMWDLLATKPEFFNHVPGGSNVLYMDGHVEFLKYSREQKSPANETFALAGGLMAQ
jgi:prepilin-type processing-associated H-X9-DG protein